MTNFTTKVAKYGGGFTEDQEKALDLLSAWYSDPKDLFFTLSGRAGTGKTYLLKHFVSNIVKQPICVSAPTHKAVRQVERSTGRKGKTLQSLHGLRPNTNLEDFDLHNIKFDQLGNPTMNNYKIVIIDECSMINPGLHELNARRAKDLGVKILYVGDPVQLPPVSKNEGDITISPTFNIRNHYELKEIVRQNKGNPLTNLLNILVDDVHNQTSNFVHYLKQNPVAENISGEGYKVYTDHKAFMEVAVDCFKSDLFSDNPDYARLAAWKNQTVLNYNIGIRAALHLSFYGEDEVNNKLELVDLNDLLIGYKTINDEYNEIVITNSEDYVLERIIPRESDGGFKIYAAKIRPRHGGRAVEVNIVDYRDKSFLVYYETIKHKYFKALYATGNNRSTRWREYFAYKDSYLSLINFPIKDGDNVKTYVSKDLDYAFSLTTHKLQGSTIENVFIDLNDMLFYTTGKPVINSSFNPNATTLRNKLIYTAISRSSKMCHIYLNIQ